MVEGDTRELGKGDGEQCKINARDAEAKAEPADHCTEDRGDRDRSEHTEPGADPEVEPEQRTDVAAEPDIERVPERELPGEAHHQVPSLADESEIEDQDQHRDEIAV